MWVRSGIPIVRCCRCSLIVSLSGGGDPLAQYHDGAASPIEYYAQTLEADRRTFEIVLDRIEVFRPRKGCPASRALDVGSGNGAFLQTARERGYDVTGIEPNPRAVEFSRKHSDAPVVCGTLESFEPSGRPFDLVFLGDTLEHVTDPRCVLTRVRSLLAASGVVAVTTPDIRSFATRLFQLKPTEHLFYFSAASLRLMLRYTGFSPLAICSFDRFRNVAALRDSSTFRYRTILGLLMRAVSRLVPARACVRFPFRENLLAIAAQVPPP